MQPIRKTAFLFLIMLISCSFIQAQQNTTWTAKSAKKWADSRQWSNGMHIKLFAGVNNIEFAKQYHAHKTWWDAAFAFLRDKNLKDMPPGKYPIMGDDVFAIITNDPSKTFEQAGWESHRKYADLQYIITGEEKIGVAQLADATITKPYDDSADGASYAAEGKYYTGDPGVFFLFFPADVHRPKIKVEGFDTVKRLVIKIRVSPV